ncbi:hypothetical protein [Pedobacter xixiisoli]|uniref:Lipoprotein n=1 Tax=Pedobacter xixiisoli TaxID=1476464 RepID=A0A285ZP19_9SPHI|nr:hypothetical protein [Pedobacter xixiisoli]SOD11388.1 hypothetical protein SAMN06297358_0124 [Pedobacter xixiisoli]
MRHFIFCFAIFGMSTLVACGVKKNQSLNNSQDVVIANEVLPVAQKPCFEGAYYRKLVSSHDYWRGIEGTVILPTIIFDEDRKHAKKPGQYLDNPSIYLGGSMGNQETDIGLTWEVIKEDNGQVSKIRKAFRPFLRRTEHDSGQKSIFENAPAQKQYYWYPGEEVKMSLLLVSDKKVRFVVEGAGKKFERDFDCDGYLLSAVGEFKRVNAIDQVANEGKPVQATKTKVQNAEWKQTNLFRLLNNEVVAVPFKKTRYTEMMCPAANNFKVKASYSQVAKGAEVLSISGVPFQ